MAYKGEHHAILLTKRGGFKRAHYCGPGTQLKRRLAEGSEPISAMDNICQKHDIAYEAARTPEDIRTADAIMLARMSADPRIPWFEKKYIGFLIRTKMIGETLRLFGPETFTTLPGLHSTHENQHPRACNKRKNIALCLDERARKAKNLQRQRSTIKTRKITKQTRATSKRAYRRLSRYRKEVLRY